MAACDSCRDWDYERHPDAGVVASRCIRVLAELARGTLVPKGSSQDSRQIHRRLFKDLTPAECPYFAGNYRGSGFPCLQDYDVTAGGMATTPAAIVAAAIAFLSSRINVIYHCLDAGSSTPSSINSRETKLLYLVCFVAEIHSEFLRIHPYANGNGHVGRFIVWCVLGAYGYWPKSWPFDDRPGDPYLACLTQYRSGNQEPLIQLMLKLIAGD